MCLQDLMCSFCKVGKLEVEQQAQTTEEYENESEP